jgi:hypothetical protein
LTTSCSEALLPLWQQTDQRVPLHMATHLVCAAKTWHYHDGAGSGGLMYITTLFD